MSKFDAKVGNNKYLLCVAIFIKLNSYLVYMYVFI